MIGPEVTVPDVTEAVTGFRQFSIVQFQQHNYRLEGPHQGEPWPMVEQTAKCLREIKVPESIVLPRPPKPHRAPHKGCGCGIYVYFDPCPVGPKPEYYWMRLGGPPHVDATKVQALMSLSGTIEVHARGMRAERGRICALGLNPQLTMDELAGLREIARQFDVPLVPEEQLSSLESEYGRPLPESMRPEAPVEPPRPQSGLAALEEVSRGIEAPSARRSRSRYVSSLINGAAAALNGTLMAVHFSPVNLTCMALSAAIAVKSWPRSV